MTENSDIFFLFLFLLGLNLFYGGVPMYFLISKKPSRTIILQGSRVYSIFQGVGGQTIARRGPIAFSSSYLTNVISRGDRTPALPS